MTQQWVKDPDAVLDWEWDWSGWLDPDETITDHTVTAPDGITLSSSSATATTVLAWLSGGSAGASYQITCEVVTSAGRTDDRTIRIDVVDR